MVILFNIIYFLLFLLWLGCYYVLDYGVWANNELLKKLTSTKDKRIIKAIRNNCKRGRWILYIIYLLSLVPFFILNIRNENIFLFFILLTAIFLLVHPLRNIISNIAIKTVLKQNRIKEFLLKKTDYKKTEKN